jgi:hypothetical protein
MLTRPAGARRRRRRCALVAGEALEPRALRAATADPYAILGATTADSKGVTVHYQVEGSMPAGPLTLGVYRSVDAAYEPGDPPVGPAILAVPAVDDAGRPSNGPGEHVLTVPIPGGIPPAPKIPYVVVVADPGSPGATDPGRSASYLTVTIGVIVHGGAQASSSDRYGPGWEERLAAELRAEGYNFVIPYVWASKSWTPGAAVKQIPRVADLIDRAAAMMPAGAVVDLHVIGHSEGTVIASRALAYLQPPPGLARGYVELTLLDPYPANNASKRTQYSAVGGLLGYVARRTMASYQAKAKDPDPYIPAIVDDAQVYYQHTPVGLAKAGLINFWGMTRIASAPGVPVQYADLTGPGVSHSGDFSVRDWYIDNIVPHLGIGPLFLDPGELTATRSASAGGGSTFSGDAAPGASVEVFASPPGSRAKVGLGRAMADAEGHWSLDAGPAGSGPGRFFARSAVPAFPGARRTMVMHTVRIPTG